MHLLLRTTVPKSITFEQESCYLQFYSRQPVDIVKSLEII